MKLSIITINKNNAQGLEKTIKSVIEQNFKDFEYIVIDGNSTDESVQIIKKYQDKINYWLSEPDSGIFNAMNKGIKVAKGEYLLFLNSGDFLINSDVLERIFEQNFNEDIVYGSLKFHTGKIKDFPSELTLLYLLKQWLPHQASFIKRSLFEKIGLYDEKYKIASDWKFFLEAIVKYEVSYKKIDIVVSYVEPYGISSTYQTFEERDVIFREVFPLLYPDYKYLFELERKIHLLQSSRFFKICDFFKRFLTGKSFFRI